MKKTILLLLLAILAALFQAVKAQTGAVGLKPNSGKSTKTAVVATADELDSKLMARKMPYHVLLPFEYDQNKAERFPVIYLLHGLWGNYKNWVEKTALLEYAARHKIIIVNPEGGNGWYVDNANQPNDKYESYVVAELIPEIDKKFRTIAERKGRAVAGLSMGGYGAIKFGVKYPEKFIFAASMSGAVNAASWKNIEENAASLRKSLAEVFVSADNPTHRENDLFKIFSELPPEKGGALPFFYLDCGTEDSLNFLQFNRQLADIMLQRKIPHEFRELPGKHDWAFWNQQIVEVLRIGERIFDSQKTSAAK